MGLCSNDILINPQCLEENSNNNDCDQRFFPVYNGLCLFPVTFRYTPFKGTLVSNCSSKSKQQ